jgi:hypothetical protein
VRLLRIMLRVSLEVDSAGEVVQVSAGSTLLETRSCSVQQLAEDRTINALPLNGRNAQFIAQLWPGVADCAAS